MLSKASEWETLFDSKAWAQSEIGLEPLPTGFGFFLLCGSQLPVLYQPPRTVVGITCGRHAGLERSSSLKTWPNCMAYPLWASLFSSVKWGFPKALR